MRNHLYILLLLLVLPVFLKAQPYTFKGVILDKFDSSSISEVNIELKGSGLGTTTGSDGSFSITVQAGDTLSISAVQYKPITLVAFRSEEIIILYLEPQLYELDEVTIKSFSKEKFRDDFLNLNLPPDPYSVDLNIPADISYIPLEQDIQAPASSGAIPAGAGITVYPNWDFRANQLKWQRKQVALWKEREAFQEYVEARYNADVVKKYVDITDEQLEAFLKFCDLQDDFIADATEYEIAEAIKECYLVFVE